MPRTSNIPPTKARLFLQQEGLAASTEVELDRAQAHYLLDVMRGRVGDRVLLFNGRDGEWLSTITRAERRHCALELTEQTRVQEPEDGPTLLFAPIKKSRLDMLVEKATELGVRRLIPVQTRRSIVDRVNGARLRAITIEAAEQCGRLTLPEISDLQTLNQVLKTWPKEHPLYVGDETGGGEPILKAINTEMPAAFLIGPEGGFDPSEVEGFDSHPFVKKIDLGSNILRAETAGLMALACWRSATASRDRSPNASAISTSSRRGRGPSVDFIRRRSLIFGGRNWQT
ncbi:MAG: 16S rRNA (uracil(1498)-N(3))-methyltransferase, partial [Geminicoccaceae bacterium]